MGTWAWHYYMIFCDQDMMDELLQSLYPVYSMAREFSNPYKVNIATISAIYL